MSEKPVDPSAQRLGAGRALVDACIARARADGMQAIWVAASERMAGARALFATVGFVMDPSPADSQSVDDLVAMLTPVMFDPSIDPKKVDLHNDRQYWSDYGRVGWDRWR